MHLILSLLACLISLNYIEGARILSVFPCPSISHQVVFRQLTQELAKRGHEVVVITTDPMFSKNTAPENLEEIDIHDITYKVWKDLITVLPRGREETFISHVKAGLETVISLVDVMLKSEQVRNMLLDDNQKFDLIFAEACIRPALIFSHIYKAPLIQISSLSAVYENYEVIGAPVHPFLYPASLRQRLNNLTKWEKVKEFYKQYWLSKLCEDMKAMENIMLKKHFGDDTPTIDDLNNNVHMLFLNVNPIFYGIRPVPPSVVFMGGLHQKPPKDLPTDIKTYLDSSKNGTIYVSFGTNTDPSQLPPEIIKIFVRAFSQLPYDILWKWNKNDLAKQPENIKIFKWLPQSDLLRHSNVKLFITQGGLQSTDEAITAGVPLIGIPLFGDQWYNVERYEYHKIGIRLDIETITVEKLIKTVNAVIGDDSYRHNIIKLRDCMRDEPMRPLERAVWWTEYVLRHRGALHLRSPAANISWSKYYEWDLVFTLLLIASTIIVLAIIVIYFIFITIKKYAVTKIKHS